MILLLLSVKVLLAQGSCQCYPNVASKRYQLIENTWYGKKVKFSCDYECQSPSGGENVTAFYDKNIWGREKGNEIICEGTNYIQKYSTSSGWFYWEYRNSYSFNPYSSKNQNLNDWGKTACPEGLLFI